MTRKVLYDFSDLQDDPADLIDGSDEMLPEDERVTAAALRSPAYGLLRLVQEEAGLVPPRLSPGKAK